MRFGADFWAFELAAQAIITAGHPTTRRNTISRAAIPVLCRASLCGHSFIPSPLVDLIAALQRDIPLPPAMRTLRRIPCKPDAPPPARYRWPRWSPGPDLPWAGMKRKNKPPLSLSSRISLTGRSRCPTSACLSTWRNSRQSIANHQGAQSGGGPT